LINSDDKGIELHERFTKYEMELSAANRKIADRKFFRVLTDVIVTLITSHPEKSTTLVELQIRMEKLSEQVNALEDDKRKLTKEKDDLQQQLIKQKDRILEVEQDARYSRGVYY
jgi:phage-related minor tail protein